MEEANFYHALKIDNEPLYRLYALHERVPYRAIRIRDGRL